MDNYDDRTVLTKGVTLAFESFEKARNIITSEMLIKSTELIKIMINGETRERKEEGDAIVKSIEKDEVIVKKLSKLIELKEEYINLFNEE